MKLDVGGGTEPRDPSEFYSVDVAGQPHVKANMWDLPILEKTVDEIWSSHTLEHAPIARVNPTLKEFFRVLKPKGRLILSVPNFDYVAKYWLTGGDRAWAEALVFGRQTHDGEFHRAAFTPGTVKADLEAVGFQVKHVSFRWSYNQETIQAVAVRPS